MSSTDLTFQLQLAQSEERYNSLVNSHALAVEAALRKVSSTMTDVSLLIQTQTHSAK